jgi:Flp pilus assembly protein TadG
MICRRARKRRAATIVEAAMVISIVLMFMFGIFEYGRFVMTLQAIENAAREGARYAVVHTNDATTVDVQNRVRDKMAGIETKLDAFQVTVSGIILRPQTSSVNAGDPLTDWTNASMYDGISVQVTGNFKPVLPSFLGMSSTIPISVKSVMYSEGN